MLILDGSRGEGGGQILRTALALSLITGQAFRLTNIRAGRKKPGLRPQHLTCVLAAQSLGAAQVKGAGLHSQELCFSPQTLAPGHYHFNTGGAGSTMLVLQSILPALIQAKAPSHLVLEGGTHNPLSPPYPFIARAFIPLIQTMGPQIEMTLDRPGFFPAGGGRCQVKITPARLSPIELPQTQETTVYQGRILIAKLPRHIAEREQKELARHWRWPLEIEELPAHFGPGNVILLEAQGKDITQIETGFGIRGVQAEKVALDTWKRFKNYLKGPPVGEYLADQLLLPLALAGKGHFYTGPLSLHTTTNIETIEHFLALKFEVNQVDKACWRIGL